jgi:hypothetical protein
VTLIKGEAFCVASPHPPTCATQLFKCYLSIKNKNKKVLFINKTFFKNKIK